MLLVALATATVAPLVSAQPQGTAAAVSPDAARKAQQLFEEAGKLVEREKWAEAEAKFLAAWNLQRAVDVAVGLGQTQARLKKHREAAEHLDYAIRNWSTVTRADVRERAVARLAEMKKEIGTVTVKVNAPGALVRVNGKEIGTAPIDHEIFVGAGEVTIEAQATGYKPASQKLKADKGKRYDVALVLETEAAEGSTVGPSASGSVPPALSVTATASAAPTSAPMATASPVPPQTPRSKVPGFVIGGVGVASVIVGGVLVGTAEGKRGEVRSKLPLDSTGKPACGQSAPPGAAPGSLCDELRTTAAAANTLGNTGIALFAIGGAAMAGAVVYWLWPSKPAAPVKPASVLLPVIASDGGGLQWTGSF